MTTKKLVTVRDARSVDRWGEFPCDECDPRGRRKDGYFLVFDGNGKCLILCAECSAKIIAKRGFDVTADAKKKIIENTYKFGTDVENAKVVEHVVGESVPVEQIVQVEQVAAVCEKKVSKKKPTPVKVVQPVQPVQSDSGKRRFNQHRSIRVGSVRVAIFLDKKNRWIAQVFKKGQKNSVGWAADPERFLAVYAALQVAREIVKKGGSHVEGN